VACEDTRHTRVLLQRHGIRKQLLSLHEQNERARTDELVRRIEVGEVVALVSDAGTPLISDPGFALVRGCIAQGLHVEVLPGPSAVVTALVASGLPADRWCFIGFLPRRRAELEEAVADRAETLVAFESPRRLAGALAALSESQPDRPAAVCRELTKLHEEVRRGSVSELAEHYRDNPARGEVVLVLGAAPGAVSSLPQALQALREIVAAGAKARPAAGALARLTGLAANELYRELMRAGQ
jgi:16S rRNA (cytidine1402-2'-O)-methyltransferase